MWGHFLPRCVVGDLRQYQRSPGRAGRLAPSLVEAGYPRRSKAGFRSGGNGHGQVRAPLRTAVPARRSRLHWGRFERWSCDVESWQLDLAECSHWNPCSCPARRTRPSERPVVPEPPGHVEAKVRRPVRCEPGCRRRLRQSSIIWILGNLPPSPAGAVGARQFGSGEFMPDQFAASLRVDRSRL